MPPPEQSPPMPGSQRPPLPGATSSGPLGPDERVEVTVVLRPRSDAPDISTVRAMGAQRPAERQHLSRAELSRARASSPEDVAVLERFATESGLHVEEADPERRRIVLVGPARLVGQAFGVTLERYIHPGGTYRGHAEPVHLPEHLADVVVAVLGLDDRPQAGPRVRVAVSPSVSYAPPQVAAAYGFPAQWDGTGQTVAMIELGGGFRQADLDTYFADLGLPTPQVEAVPVDGGGNAPTGDPSGPDGEVMLDIEVSGSVANKARLAVYFAPNTDRGFVDAVSAAVHDTVRAPSVVSISWGGPEETYTAPARAAFEAVLTDAALAGVSICVASGDSGSTDGVGDGLEHVDYPASSPQVLACGGTRLVATGTQISSETVWNDQPAGGATGGGVSAVFPVPSWQAGVGVPPSANPGAGTGRGVPDVAANADPDTGYRVRIDGTDTVVGGTSAAAPMWAALLALGHQAAGRPLGFVNPDLYRSYGTLPKLAAAFHDITQGDNGAYRAAPGWDPCSGMGSPKGSPLVDGLS